MAQDQYQQQQYLQVQSPGSAHPSWQTLSQYGQTYFSGLDTAIYFEDLYISEIVNLQMELQEAVYPLRPYGAFKKRGTMHGARQVMGSFTVNFQQMLLTWLMIEHIRQTQTPQSLQTSLGAGGISVQPNAPLTTPGAIQAAAKNLLVPEAIEQYNEVLVASPPASKNGTALYQSAKRLQSTNISSIKDRADQLKQKFNWARDTPSPITGPGSSLLQSVFNSLSARAFQSLFDTPNGFTIGCIMGDASKQDYLSVYGSPGDVVTQPEAYGAQYLKMASSIDNSDVTQALSQLPPWSVLKITGVELTGFGMVIDDSGRPLLQTFSFIADDII